MTKTKQNLVKLTDRKIIEITGLDSKKFLQGLVTNNVNKLEKTEIIYSAMLNNQGRFLYDFFLFEIENKIYLDCLESRREEIIKKLNFYKLKSDVTIEKNDKINVFSSDERQNSISFEDPRNKKMGFRSYLKTNLEQNEQNYYHAKRINLKIAESEHDLTYEKSIIAEFGFDDISAIDYEKGCYIGQELTARTHHLGQVRKKIFHIQIENAENLQKNQELYCQNKKIGILLSSVKINNRSDFLTLMKVKDDKSLDLPDKITTDKEGKNELNIKIIS